MHHHFQRTWIAAVLASPLWALAQTPPPANALPTGGQVAAGQAQIQQNAAAMTIQQGSARAAIDWQSFNIGRDARVEFQQPSAQSVLLNRVQGPDASQIFGRISANGQVFLSNPNGVYFAPGASVDVGGLVATTHRISLEDFMAGRTRFERQGATGSVVNEGELRAALGGYIALLAPEVRNQGVVVANLGTVALAAGEAFELQFDANNTLAGLRVEPATVKALVDNRSAVLAPGGLVILSAQALDRVQGGVIRNSGRIEATGLAQRGGRIVLEASSQIANSGSIDASATAHGPAGSVRLQAPEVLNTGSIEAKGSVEHPAGGTVEIVAGNLVQAATGRIDVSAPQLGGTVRVQASGKVELAGSVSAAAEPAPAPTAAPSVGAAPATVAAAPAQSGEITVQAAQIELVSARLDASGGQQGGRIVLDASAPAPSAPPAPEPAPERSKVALLGTTQLTTRGRRGQGGTLTLLGDDIGLKDQTALDATGATQGGTVRVGGGWQGGEGLYQATTVSMAEGAVIDASATQQGHGGSAVLWSDLGRADGLTTAAGSILARGAGAGGHGGKVETSGHQVDSAGARVNAGADAGQGGTGGLWLIDPSDTTITQAVANSYRDTLNTGTSVLNEVTGSITWNSGVALAKTAGGDATLTLRASNNGDITLNNASITSSAGALNLVLWTRYNNEGGAGAITLAGSTITTNGGHVWMGGGDAAGALWNGLTVGRDYAATYTANAQAVKITGTAISIGAGNIQIKGQSFATGVTTGTSNYGVWINAGSSIGTTSGSIDIQGDLRGRYANGFGTLIGTAPGGAGNVTVSTTTGAINVLGTGTEQSGSSNDWRVALMLWSANANDQVVVKSTSGAITLRGDANFSSAFTSDSSGLQMELDQNSGSIQVVSRSGAINLQGSHASEASGQMQSAIRFTARDAANSIRIGYDGTNSYSGDVLIEGNSLYQRYNNAGVGSISVQSTGALTMRSAGNAFTYLRAGTSGSLSFDNDWNFGSTLSSFTFGKSTNTLDLTLSNALSVAGGINLYAGQIALNAALTSTGTGDINLIANTASNASIVSNGSGTISKAGGGDGTLTVRSNGRLNLGAAITNTSTSGKLNVVLWSDYGNTTSLGVSNVPTVTTRGGHLWVGGSNTAGGSTVWNGLTVGDGPSVGGGGNANAMDLAGAINTSNGSAGGDVYLWSHAAATSLNGFAGFTGITAGNGNITLRGSTFNWSGPLDITTTGAFTLWSGAGTINSDTGSLGQVTNLNYFRFNANPGAFTWGGAGNTQNVTFSNTYNPTLTVAGPISIYGGAITLGNNLVSTAAGAGVLFKGRGGLIAGGNITTQGGDITLWSNSAGAAAGGIQVNDGVTLSSTGGAITLGGSANNTVIASAPATSANGTALPQGYAGNMGSSMSGIVLGTYSGITGRNANVTLNSGNGRIGIAGQSSQYDADLSIGLLTYAGINVNAGTGDIVLNGLSTGATAGKTNIGFTLAGFFGNNSSAASKWQTNGGTITMNGASTGATGTAIGADPQGGTNGTTVTIQNTSATSGGIAINGSATNGSSSNSGVRMWNTNILSRSGAITLNANSAGNLITQIGGYTATLGSLAGSDVTSSSANIALTGDALSIGSALNVNTAGTLVVQPLGNNFTSALSTTGLTLASSVSGLRLGKDIGSTAHTDTITVANPLSIAGPYSLYGGTLNLNADLTSTLAGAGILAKASGNIVVADGKALQTNGGDITLWADSDGSNAGYIQLVNNNRLDSRTAAARTANVEAGNLASATGGGRITLGGGSGATAADGYAVSAGTTGLGGVNLGDQNNVNNATTLYSGGGDVVVRGKQTGNSAMGVQWINGGVLNAGQGTVRIDGQNTGGGHGVELGAFRQSGELRVLAGGGDATTAAIDVRGTGAGSGNGLQVAAAKLYSLGTGGIGIAGTAGASGNWGITAGTTFDAQAVSGAITLDGGSAGISTVGSLAALAGSPVASSSSNVTLTGNRVQFSGGAAVRTTGTLTVQPWGQSFSSALTWPLANLVALAPSVSGLTLGKEGNTANINVASAVTIAGPIRLYGGNIALNAGLTSTMAGASILAKASGNIVIAANTSLTTNLGNLTLWADSDASGQGYIAMDQGVRMNTVNGATSGTGGGRLTLAGGLDTDADGIPDGFAVAASTDTAVIGPAHNPGAGINSHAPGGVTFGFYEHTATYTNDLRFYTGGGDVLVKGQSANTSPGIAWYGGQDGATQLVDAGTGTVTLNGQSSAGHGIELSYFASTSSPTIRSASNAPTAIRITGTSTNPGSSGYQGAATFIASGTGGITLSGTAKDGGTGVTGVLGVYAASGGIDITGTVTGTGTGPGISMAGGLGKGGGLSASSSNIVLNADRIAFTSAEAIDSTGTLTVQPLGTSFASTLNWPLASLTLAPTLSGLTLGKAGNIADITVTAAHSVAGPIRIYGGNINLNANLSSTLLGAGISALASGSITTNNAITLSTNGGALLLAADTDGAGGGLINATGNFTASTSGGAITLGGGLDGTGYALGFGTGATNATGIRFRGTSTLNSGGGNISIKGKSHTSAGNANNAASGLWFDGSSSIDSGTGTVVLEGVGQAASNDLTVGVMFGAAGGATTTSITSANTTANAIRLVGNAATAGNASFNSGFRFYSNGTSITATGLGGGITLEGTRNTAGNAHDFSFADSNGVGTTSSILARSGPIVLSGKTVGGLAFLGAMTLGSKAGTAVTSSTSNVTLTADGLTNVLAGSAVNTSGTLTVQPLGNSFTGALSWPINNLALASTVSGLTLGKVGSTADITLASAVNIAGPVNLYGGNLALNAGLTASTVTLQASGTVSDGASGFVSAANLLLLGGNVLLDSASTSIGTLAASGVGSLEVRNSGALTVGSVGGTNGIAASGTVAVSTQSGDLTVAGPVSTSNSGTSAIVLNAGRAAAAGTAAGGNLVASGSPLLSMGAGGRATLYSGSVAGSTGLAALVGAGAARYRYNSDESASNFSTALGSGTYAIYREQPSVALSWGSQSVVYGTAPSAFGYTVTSGSLQSGEAPTAAVSGGVYSGAGHLAVSATPYAVADSGALAALGYSVTQTSGTVTVTPRLLAASYSGASRDYNGALAVSVAASGDDRLAGDVLSVSASGSFADANVGTGKAIAIQGGSLSGADAGNYVLASGGSTTGDITPRTVTVGGAVVANKVYDGTTDATLLQAGQVSTGVGSETLVLSATDAAFATAGAGTGKTVTVSGYALANGANGGLASNYRLAGTSATTTADIAKAVLTVVANSDAKFITQADAAGYNGVAYTGFVNGETASVLGGSAVVARSNAGEGAQVYNGVLVVDTAGLSAANYSFQTRNGDFTIVPSNQLLVRVANTVGTYGAATVHSVTSAHYFDGVTVVTLAGVTDHGGNRFTVSDGVGGTATLTVAPTAAPVSSGGWTGVGAWQLAGTQVSTQNAANFSNTVTVVGSETVGARGISVNTAGGVAKVYDGTTAMPSVTLQLAGAANGDVLGVSAQGSFASRNAGSNIAYTVNGIALSGADAANYYVTGGTSFSGSNGSITPRTLHVGYTGVDKVYDGSTAASVASSDDRIAGDLFSVNANAAFADKNVGSGKLVGISGALLSGSDAGNYQLASTTGSTTASITRLASVTWVGGSSGDWFDPANWAGGAVPDLANVANVVIPQGVTVRFDTGGLVAPAQAGPVQIDSLGGAGGGLVQNDGALNVGGGGITLDQLQQHGGSLHSDGAIALKDFTQTGGSTSTLSNLTVTENFAQGPNGTVAVQGGVRITDIGGGVTLGNLTAGGGLDVVSTDGDITQAGGTAITVGGETRLDAGAGSIVLDGPNNDFQGAFNASGKDITVVDGAGGLVIGNIDASGDLDARSTGGDITQQAGTVVRVEGTTTVDAGTGSIVLDGSNNDFQGPFNASGKDITVVDGTGGLVIGNIDASGDLDARSTGGDVTQQAGTVVRVEGTTTVDAGTGSIVLDGPNNDFQGPFNASGKDITVVDGIGGLVIGNIAASGDLDATSTGGDITQQTGTEVRVEGTTTVDAGMGSIVLDGPNNDFQGPFNASGKDITVVDGTGGLVIGNIDASGDLDARSTGGDITQQAGTVVRVEGTTTVDAGTGSIVLDGAGNDFQGPFNASGKDIMVVDGAGGLVIGNIDASGNLDATSTGGDVTQQAGTVVRVEGTTTVDAGTGSIVLDGPNNDFQGPFNASGKDITVVDGTGGLVIGNIDASGNLAATSTGGDITQQTGTVVRVEGTTTVDAGTGSIVLDGPNNDFQGPFNGRGKDITVVDGSGGLVIGNIDASGNFDATSTGGNITQQTGTAVHVGGATTVDAGTADIVLDGPANDFTGPFNASGRDITVVDGTGGLVVGDIAGGGRFVATSTGGSITQAGGTVIAVAGNAVFSAPGASVTLAASGNLFGGSVDLNGSGNGQGGGEVLPVVVPPVMAPPPLPVPETAPQAIEASGMLVLAGNTVSAVAPAALGDGVAVRLVMAPSAQGGGLVTVEVPQQMTATGFSFTLPQALTAGLAADAPVTATLEDGSPLPAWLQFDAESRRFTASAVPPAGLPIRVRIDLGGRQLVVQIAVAAGR